MSKKLRTRSAIFAALLAAWGVSGAALAVDEVEPNNPVGSAQHLVIGPDGTVTVNGVIGVLSGPATRDVDFYSFQGQAGDVITVDIDGGMHADGTGVDTIVAIFGPDGSDPLSLLRQNDDGGYPLDDGSVSPLDARIDNFSLPVSGTYVIGVSSFPGSFLDVNTLATSALDATSNGAYTLIVSGVTPSIQQINIDIKPGRNDVVPIDPKGKGSIPVALLSSPAFDALQVDPRTLRFGETGNEQSLVRCHEHGKDVNRDGLPDLVCHFDNRKAGFKLGDQEGILTGATTTGMQFEGRGWLKVVAGKRHFGFERRRFERDGSERGDGR